MFSGEPRVDRSAGKYRLSPLQAGMVFQALLHDATGKSQGYDIEQIHVLIAEPLALSAFEQAWTLVARRHPALCASIDFSDGDVLTQSIHADVVVPVEVRDWRALSASDRATRLDAFLREDRLRGFDLRSAPLQRVAVLLDDGGPTEFVWTFHHILLDGRSFSTVIGEVLRVHAALRDGTALELPPAPRPFAEYVDWLSARDFSAARTYFRELLQGKHDPTPLPDLAPRAGRHEETGAARFECRVDPAIHRRAQEMARRTHTTLGTLVLAAWAIVLARFTGDEDVVFGTMRHGRRSALDGEAEAMVGLFTNTVPVRVRLGRELRVGELLRRIRAESLRAREFDRAPLSEIQRVSDMPHGPLFHTLVLFEDRNFDAALRADPEFGRKYQRITLHEQPPFPLTVKVSAGEALCVVLTYERARFSERGIDRLARALVWTLDELAQDEAQEVDALWALPPKEREKILSAWNQTDRGFPDHTLLHEAFERRARSQPDAVALEVSGESITFHELDRRAEALARILRARGAARDVCIGVCLPRNAALVVTLLAICKTGAAYLPLDARYPSERLQFMLTDAQAAWVVTDARLGSMFSTPTVTVEAEGRAESALVADGPWERAGAEDICYVIYTSGSTGTPKGVVLTHRAVVNTCDWVNRTFAVGPGDRLLFVTSPSFDLSVYDLFGALGAGATVVIAEEDLLADPEALARALVEREITIWDSAPAALELVVPFLPAGVVHARLRLILLSGDRISLELVRAVRNTLRAARLVSLGGATEAAIWSNWFPIDELDPGWTSVPYGRPIQNCRYYALDDQRRPVPVGVCGELYIGGACVAQGYRARPELTAERFVPDPFSSSLGARLFRTGDLVRYLEDGTLEILGRRDRQLKIRGFRVEIAEVEAALGALTGVRAAAVRVDLDAAGQKSLTAFVVAEPARDLSEASIKHGLARTLPEFMIPAQVLVLAALPLTPNGKVDLGALPKLAARAANAAAPRTPGFTETERRVAEIWQRVLQRAAIDRDDDFFALGGHSLSAVLVFDRINRAFDLKIPLAVLFECPTIRLLAARLDELRAAAARSAKSPVWTTLVPIQSRGSLPPLFCVAGVGGNPIGERRLAAALGANQPVYGLQHRGVDGQHEPHRNIRDMAREFLADIRKVQAHGPYHLGGFSAGGVAAFELASQLTAMGESVALLVLLDTFNPTLAKWSSRERMQIFARLTYHYGVRYAAQRLAARAALKTEQLRGKFFPASANRFEERHIALQAAFVAALDAYVPEPYAGRTLLVRSTPSRCPDVDYRPHESNGWRALLGPELQIACIDCRHDELLERQVGTVADLVRSALARVQAKSTSGRHAPPGAGSE